jgi:Na+:H+ antiporter, NhaA family
MAFLRSERYAAFLLIGAAVLGILLANSPVGAALIGLKDTHFGFPTLGIDLSLGHWATDGLLAIFFFIAAIELKHELTAGELDTPRKALVPTIAAVGGVIAPAIIYLLMVQDKALQNGWPIPTATDIAFALGVLALVGKGLPSRVRALLLAIAVIDDLIAILIIAIFFTNDFSPLPLLLAVPVVLLFGLVSGRIPASGARRVATIGLLVVLGVLTWILIFLSGIHATIAGVALGLIMAGRSAGQARHALEPWSNGLVLPVFAFAAALVPLPTEGVANLSPAFWGIVVALPVGKLIGITAGASIAIRLSTERRSKGTSDGPLPLADLVAVAALGGIGFTVSLLMNELAFAGDRAISNEGTLAVIVASVVAALVGVTLTVMRSRHYLRETPSTPGADGVAAKN